MNDEKRKEDEPETKTNTADPDESISDDNGEAQTEEVVDPDDELGVGDGEDELGADDEALATEYLAMQKELAAAKKSMLRKDGKPLAQPPAGAIDRIAELTEILTTAGQPLEAPEVPGLEGNLICSACKTPYAGHEVEFTQEGPGITRHRCGGLAMKM